MSVPFSLLRYTHETAHFILHYTYVSDMAARTDRHYDSAKPLSARHGVSSFAYIENYAMYFEAGWRHYFTGSVRYRVPPGIRGNQKYRVHVCDIGQVYGVTYPDRLLADGRSTSFIAVRNNYRGFQGNDDAHPEQGSMKVTAAHEFYHAVQFGYPLPDGSGWDWWMEASATFIEDDVFDAVNDYQHYLPNWFGRPELPLDHVDGSHEYGSVIFCKYLAEKVNGAAIFEAVLRRARQRSALQAIDGVLKEHRRGLAAGKRPDVFSTGFLVSNLFKDHPDLGYEEGRRYPAVRVDDAGSSYPVSTRTVALDHLSAAYVRFRPPTQPRTLHLAFGIEGVRRVDPPARIAVVVQAPAATVTRHEVALRRERGGLFGGVEVPGFGRTAQVREAVAVIANTTWGARTKDGLAVTYAASLA
jgi:hypothetical protein